MKTIFAIAAALSATLLLTACVQPGAGAVSDTPSIEGAWSVAEIDGAAIPASVPVTAVFSGDGRVGGVSGCNNYGGNYSYKRGVVTVTEVSMTQMACMDEQRMEVEAKFHQRFTGELTAASLPDGALSLNAGAGSLVLRREAK
ncbi:MAG: META domain-containing protein [Pseudomonadota bacterium]